MPVAPQHEDQPSDVDEDARGIDAHAAGPERVDATSGDLAAELRDALRELAPSAFSLEGELDVETLRGLLGEEPPDADGRYRFSWAGQAEAVRVAGAPTAATLRPQPERGTGWDAAPNAFVEGDNLQVLKLLTKSYFGTVKLAYLDPPYNTGTDRLYRDDFADSIGDYLHRTGQKNDDGDLLVANPEGSGRLHSAWLSMMYPRLHIARRLLRPDGVLVAAIDDNEVAHLRLLLDSVFGPENFVASMVWEGGVKNDASFVSVGHDYMLIYARDQSQLKEKDGAWRVPKPGVQAIVDKVEELQAAHGDDHATATEELRAFLAPLQKDVLKLAAACELVASTYPNVAAFFPEITRPLTELPGQRYNRIDERGAFRGDNLSWPGGGGPTYDVAHPVTGKPVRKPSRGWLYAEEDMQLLIDDGRIDFKGDETGVPEYKRYLHETEREVVTSVFYRTRTKAAQDLTTLMGAEVFEHPKDPDVIGRVVEAATSGDDLVLDFFGGSGSTAEAVMRTNARDGGKRRWLVVTLPEETPADSGARKAGFQTISDAAVARIKKSAEANDVPSDLAGYRVFTLDRSALASWSVPEDVEDADGYIAAQTDMSSDIDGLDVEAAVWQVAIREGYPLTSKTTTLTDGGHTVWRVSAAETGLPGVAPQPLFVCLDAKVTDDLTQRFEDVQGETLVVRESALDDSVTANMSMHCRLKTL
jgi:adenine-specific DNA-methyltransferase